MESEEILKERDGLAIESKSRLEKGIVKRFCVFCCSLNHVNRFVVCCVKLMERWRDVFVVNDICFYGQNTSFGDWIKDKTLLTGREQDARSLQICLHCGFVCTFSFV